MTDHNKHDPKQAPTPAPVEMTMYDREAAGRLIVGMAIGEIPKPTTTAEALQLLKDHGITLENFAASGKEIRVVSRDEALYVVLPPADLMRQRIEEYSKYPGPYPLPDEYALQVRRDPNALDALDMFYFRVGDYSFGQCR
ncbi:hypothetical protein [Inquilinus sp. OTU3971]|uniref:hypothetical protein n=1 Tax=Inquilinus sp. OTU3971 TaxID=3043855 RepID=UPI00313CFDAF